MNKNFNKGFTIIELIVVIAVFLLIIGVAITIFISIVSNQKKILSEVQFLNQISYVEEHMSKALRMAEKETSDNAGCLIDDTPTSPDHSDHIGYAYLLTRPQGNFYTGIKFINASDNDSCWEIYLDTSSGTGILKEITTENSSSTSLTSAGLNIQTVRFAINGVMGCTSGGVNCANGGASDTSTSQPRVTISMGVQISGDNQNATRQIQTTVSQRNINNPTE